MPQEIPSASNSSFKFDADAALDAMMNGCNVNNSRLEDIEDIAYVLNKISLPVSSPIHAFWETMQNHSVLYQIAMVVLAIPPTEVEIERGFSKLKHVFKQNRCNIDKERLEDVLLIHLNKDLFFSGIRKYSEH